MIRSSTDGGLRIGDAAASAGVSARTLRYYEEIGLLAPSGYTSGGERRYQPADLEQLGRVLEMKDVLGLGLEEIKRFLDAEVRIVELRDAYREKREAEDPESVAQRKAILEEALELQESLAAHLEAKLGKMESFRSKLRSDAERCRELLADLD